MAPSFKESIQKSFRHFGYELKRNTHAYSAFEVQALLVQTPAPVIFDVGANAGTVTREYRQRFPTALIHAFEPFPESFEELRRNTSPDPGISYHQLAISAQVGTCLLNSNVEAKTNSILPTDTRSQAAWGSALLETTAQVEVQTATLDSFCADHKIPRIDILKMDIQGAELAALEGARGLLSNQAINLIYMEIILANTYSGQAALDEYLHTMRSVQYELLDFYNPIRKNLQLIQVDAIFISQPVKEELMARSLP